jgi:hypothetical protein
MMRRHRRSSRAACTVPSHVVLTNLYSTATSSRLALLSIQILCLPFINYAGIALPGLGLVLSARGLLLSGRKLNADFAYSLAGLVACALALAFVIGTLTGNRD